MIAGPCRFQPGSTERRRTARKRGQSEVDANRAGLRIAGDTAIVGGQVFQMRGSHRPREAAAGHHGRSRKRPIVLRHPSPMPSSSAASWRTASCACAAATAATTSWWHSAASAGGFVPRAARGAGRRLRRTWWTTYPLGRDFSGLAGPSLPDILGMSLGGSSDRLG